MAGAELSRLACQKGVRDLESGLERNLGQKAWTSLPIRRAEAIGAGWARGRATGRSEQPTGISQILDSGETFFLPSEAVGERLNWR